jgi:hypothetical protein
MGEKSSKTINVFFPETNDKWKDKQSGKGGKIITY